MAGRISSVSVVISVLQLVAAAAASCPLSFELLKRFHCDDSTTKCGSCSDVWNRLNLVVAAHVKGTGVFSLPADDAEACVRALQLQLGVTGELLSSCGISSSVLMENSTTCPHVRTVADYRMTLSDSEIETVDSRCASFSTLPACASCYSTVISVSSEVDHSCLNYSFIYAAAVANTAGPSDPWVAFCFFYLRTSPDNNREHQRLIILATVIPGSILLASIVTVGLFRRRRSTVKLRREQDRRHVSMIHAAVKFSYEELRLATDGFSARNWVGSGGSGNVYRGTLRDGSRIAVKQFKNCSPAADADFVNEIQAVGSVRHMNLTALLGWCVHGRSETQHERCIVYEFMANGSLRDHLSTIPTWETRKKIIVGVARGLAYLHSGAAARILHRDVKSSNILLDEAMDARISDMGLAKFLPDGLSRLQTGTVGTKGYVAPEYVLYHQLTEKSDVYSFGIVMLEVLSGRPALIPPLSTPVADWAWELTRQGKMAEVFSAWNATAAAGEDDCLEEMIRFLLIGFVCAHPYVAYRPSMVEVVKMVEDGVRVPHRLPERPLINPENVSSVVVSVSQMVSFSSLSSRC